MIGATNTKILIKTSRPYIYYKCIKSRSFSVATCTMKTNQNLPRESKFLSKMLKGTSNKKKWYNPRESNTTPVLSSAVSLTKGGTEGKRSTNSKRVSILNKLFMKHITDLMATGEISQEFLGRGIEISQVQVTPDFNGLLVYWLAKGTENDEKIEKLLQRNSGPLRHELSQLRLMGVVPKITFIKDRFYGKLVEVDLRLAKADYGEDYEPINPSQRLKTEFILNTPLSSELKEKINKLDDPTKAAQETLPVMRNDVLGLNQADIITKIRASMKKSVCKQTEEIDTSNKNISEVPYLSKQSQTEAFEKFLLKQQIIKKKGNKKEKTFDPEKAFILEQMYTSQDNDLYLDNIPDGDYIEDLENNNNKEPT